MSHLRTPLRQHLSDPLDEPGIHRMWRGVVARRKRLPRERRRRWSYAAMAVAVAAALIVAWPRFMGSSEALTLDGGEPITSIEAHAPKVEIVRLSDGSELRLHPGAKLTALQSDGARFTTKLERGWVDFTVVPGGPRRWLVECGLATVEVVGTAFSLERGSDVLSVRVLEGTVLVRGATVEDGVVRLTAGESLRVSAETARATPDPEPQVPAAPEPTVGSGGGATDAPAATVNELMRLADAARQSGQTAEAAAILRRIVDQHPGDARAALAAYQLGTLELTSLGRPGAAAVSFQRAIRSGLAPGLVEDAHLRLVEAHVRSGNRTAARSAADSYAARFPNGRHRAAMDTLLEGE